MDDDVGFLGFSGQEIGAVEVTIDELDFSILGSDFGAFVRSANYCSYFTNVMVRLAKQYQGIVRI